MNRVARELLSACLRVAGGKKSKSALRGGPLENNAALDSLYLSGGGAAKAESLKHLTANLLNAQSAEYEELVSQASMLRGAKLSRLGHWDKYQRAMRAGDMQAMRKHQRKYEMFTQKLSQLEEV